MGGPGESAPRKAAYQGRFAVLKDIYDDPFKWGIVKSVAMFAGGIYIARQLKGFDVMQVIKAPPPGQMFQ